MFYLSVGNPKRNRQVHSPIVPPQTPTWIAETRSASGPSIQFSPQIVDLVFDQHTGYFMDASLTNSGHGGIRQPFSADPALVNEQGMFTNDLSIDTDVPLSSRRRKRASPVTPMGHTHSLPTELFSSQFHHSLAASQESSGHSRQHSSSDPHSGAFDALGPHSADVGSHLGISPSLAPSHLHQRSRSTSQILHPPSLPGSSRNPSPRPSSSSGPAKANNYNDQGTEATEPPPKKKRRRQALSCTECKRRKIKCDRVQPCAPCKKRGEGDKCQWHILEPVCVKLLPIYSDPSHTDSRPYLLFLCPRSPATLPALVLTVLYI
jgi:Fungal Zn(2)-Cys(6) binuclear cluster domain